MVLRLVTSEHAAIVYAACAIALLAACRPWRSGRRDRAIRAGGGVLVAGLTLAVLSTTLRGTSAPATQINLVPGASIFQLTQGDNRNALENVVGNVLLFMPLGFVTVAALRSKVGTVALGAAVLSVGIELTQLALGERWVDVDDVVLNTGGGLVGALVGLGALRLAAQTKPGGRGPVQARGGGGRESNPPDPDTGPLRF